MKKSKDNAVYERISKAIDNYNADIKAKKTDDQYVKNGDGFFVGEHWEHWADKKVSNGRDADGYRLDDPHRQYRKDNGILPDA